MLVAFRKWRLRRSIDRLMRSALADTTAAWCEFRRSPHYPNGATLSDRVAAFYPTAVDLYRERYPLLFADAAYVHATIINGIGSSGTVDADELALISIAIAGNLHRESPAR